MRVLRLRTNFIASGVWVLMLSAAGFLFASIPATTAHAQDSPLELLMKERQRAVGTQTRVPRVRQRRGQSGRGLFSNAGIVTLPDVAGQPARPRRSNDINGGISSLELLFEESKRSDTRFQAAQTISSVRRSRNGAIFPSSGTRNRNPRIIHLDSFNGMFSSGGMGNHNYCVRLCDGFFFPVGEPNSSADNAAHQLTCNSLCPGAETQLFSAPQGAEGIEGAMAQGKTYASLPNAFAYRTRMAKACTCNGKTPFGLARMPILADFTMRQGDVVMTSDGLKVLASGRYPHREQSFVSAYQSKRLSARERDGLKGLETGGRNTKTTERDKQNAQAASALVDKLLATDEPAPDAQFNPQELVRYIGANPEFGAVPEMIPEGMDPVAQQD